MTRVGIVGAGITGLALTHELAERGIDSVAVEAAPEPGGVIRTTREDGVVLDHGPQRLRLTEPVAALIEAAGIGDEVIEADDALPLYVYADGKLRRVPFTLREFAATDLLSVRGKLRVLCEPLTAPGRDDETAAGYLSRKFGVEAYENLIGPLFGGIYGSDPARMPVRHALSGLLRVEEREGSLLRAGLTRLRDRERPAPATFEGGMQRLPEALAERHADRIDFERPATGLRDAADGFVVETPRGAETVDRVVLTTPADATADLLSAVVPSAAGLRDLTYNPLAVVHLRSDADAAGFGYQIRADEGFDTLGVSWNAGLFDRDGLYTGFLGGMRNPTLVSRPADEIGEIAAAEFEAVMGEPAEVVNVTCLERGFPAHDESWAAVEALDLPDGLHLATNYTARMGVPSRIREARTLAGQLAAE